MINGCTSEIEQEEAPAQTFRLRSDTGIDFVNKIDESYSTFFEFFSYVYNGGGVAAGDINNDGLVDLFFTGNQVQDKLYLNKGGLKFEDISQQAGIGQAGGWSNGVTMSDVNQDGFLDIYISRGGWQEGPEERANILYINNQDGTFSERAAEYGLDDTGYSVQATFFDADNDNDLDMYLINRPPSFNLPLSVMEERAANPPDFSRDKLYINDGSNRFTELALERGIKNFGYSLGVVAGDVNNDNLIDIFVSNDYSTPDHLYINQGNGYFIDELQNAMNHTSLYSMGVDLADFNNDAMEDFIVMEMRPTDYKRSKVSMPSMNVEGFKAIVDAGMHKQYMHNMLHLNQGKGKFSDVSQLAGLAKTDWSWSPLWYDINNDGKKDLFVTNGMRRDSFDGDSKARLTSFLQENKDKYNSPQDLFGRGFKDVIEVFKPIKIPNYYYVNKGNYEFDVVSDSALSITSFSNGSIIADLDNDGDLDVVTNNIEDPAFVLENVSATGNWLKVRLSGPQGNLFGIGAKVFAYSDLGKQYFQQKLTRGYLSSQDPMIHFGFGPLSSIDSLVVIWPDNKKSTLKDLGVNSQVEIKYSEAKSWTPGKPAPPLFQDISSTALAQAWQHKDNEVDEFKEQVLLPHQFSTSGPKMATADVNGDGIEDFYVSGSRGFAGKLFLSSQTYQWSEAQVEAFELDKNHEDADAVFLDYDGDGDLDLFVASGGSDLPDGDPLYRNRLYQNNGGTFSKAGFAPTASNSSAVVAADFDQDGDLDLFVGGYVKTNHYPNADPSSFFRNDQGSFVDVTDEWASVDLGIVFDATMADLDNDLKEELVVVGEWMPVKVLAFNNGTIEDMTETFGLSSTVGWWHAISATDMDGDGDLDLVAGNLGENYKFKVSEDNEFLVYANDFDGNGTYDVFLANKKSDKLLPVRGKECSSQQMPSINTKFPTYNSFAEAQLNDILGEEIESSKELKVDMFSTVIFENKNGSLQAVELPKEAQFSTVNSIVTEDINKDGKVDLILAGNRFNTEVETTPSDASLGQLLINKGNMNFEAVPAVSSGLYLSGDIKDAHLIDGKYLVSTENQG
ncbi:MAG: VCBS repeat-containing protein, partial [Cyclobacteriaceae bacterium]